MVIRLAIVLVAFATTAYAAEYRSLPFVAQTISGDGNIVYGTGGSDFSLVKWTEEDGAVVLGNLQGSVHVWGASRDGRIVVGQQAGANVGLGAFVWTEASGIQLLGMGRGSAYGVSENGRVVGHDSAGGFSWHNGELSRLNFWPKDISSQGNVITGFTMPREAVLSVDGELQTLGVSGVGRVLTPDGSLMAGDYQDGVFVWDGDQAHYFPSSADWFPSGISADGSVIVGTNGLSSSFVLQDGMQYTLSNYLAMHGVTGTPGAAWGISDDGTKIVGNRFIATIPEPSSVVLLAAIPISMLVRRPWKT